MIVNIVGLYKELQGKKRLSKQLNRKYMSDSCQMDEIHFSKYHSWYHLELPIHIEDLYDREVYQIRRTLIVQKSQNLSFDVWLLKFEHILPLSNGGVAICYSVTIDAYMGTASRCQSEPLWKPVFYAEIKYGVNLCAELKLSDYQTIAYNLEQIYKLNGIPYDARIQFGHYLEGFNPLIRA